MATLLPRDDSGAPMHALHLKTGGAQKIITSATSTRQTNAFASTTQIIAVYATQDCFIQTGNSTITAANTDHFIPACFMMTIALRGDSYMAALQSSQAGILYISELN